MTEKFQHKKLNEQMSDSDYCEFMLLENEEWSDYIFCTQGARFAPALGQTWHTNSITQTNS